MDKRLLAPLLPQALALLQSPTRASVQAVCDLLQGNVPWYNWVGIYEVATDEERMLVLGPFAGAATDHTRIPFGRGICGQVALSHQAMVVEDVNAASNYLSCSIHVKSEVVLPIFNTQGQFVAQLDIDSHTLDAFGPEDLALLEALCQRLSACYS
jgi:GAF domain-containing protein